MTFSFHFNPSKVSFYINYLLGNFFSFFYFYCYFFNTLFLTIYQFILNNILIQMMRFFTAEFNHRNFNASYFFSIGEKKYRKTIICLFLDQPLDVLALE